MGKIVIYYCDKCKIKEQIVYPDIDGDNMPEGWFKKHPDVFNKQKVEYLCPDCYKEFTSTESLGILGGD